MNKATIRLFSPLLLAGLLLSGCEKTPEPAAPVSATPAPAATSGGEPAGVPAVTASAGNLHVSLLPESPTKKDDLRATVSGAGTAPTYSWTVNGDVVADATTDILSRDRFAKGDRIVVTARADGHDASAEALVANTPPEVVNVGYSPRVVLPGTDLVAKPEGVDADNEPIAFSYSWLINGEPLSAVTTDTLPAQYLRKGDRIAIEVTPSDSEASGPPYRTGELSVSNAAPHFTSTPPSAFRSQVFSYQARAEDADNEPLVFTLESGPTGMTIDSKSGQLLWQVGPDQGGEQVVRISVSDADGQKDTQEFRLNISLSE